jgi:exodeoxyribonuclease-3
MHNGVALLLQKKPIDINVTLLPDMDDCRYLEARMDTGIVYITVYVPQGQKIGSEKFTYKLRFLAALLTRLQDLLSQNLHVVLLGDLNLTPTDQDTFNPDSKEWLTDCMNTPKERGWFQSVLTLGYQDAFRVLHPDVRRYTWWRSFKQNWSFLKGFRLDYILIPTTIPPTALLRCSILASYRYLDNPSDHAPLLLTYRYDPPEFPPTTTDFEEL